jgi:hypothetical protein
LIALPAKKRRNRAFDLYTLHHVDRLPWADCWFHVQPDSDLSRDAAAVTAEREVKWLRHECYLTYIENRMAEYGLGIDDLVKALSAQLLATKRVHVDTIRRDYRDAHNRVVKTERRYVYKEVPNTVIRNRAAEMLFRLKPLTR